VADLLMKDLVDSQLSVSDSEVVVHYNANRETGYKTPEAVKIRQIFISLEKSGSRQARPDNKEALKQVLAKSKEIYRRLKKGVDFAQLAQAFSNHRSSSGGGEMGFVPRGELPPEVEKVVFEAEPGLLTKAIQSSYGCHIVEVFEHRAEQYQDLTGILQEAIRQTLTDQKKQARTRLVLDSLSKAYPPKFNQGGIDRLVSSQPSKEWLVRVGTDTLKPEYFSTHFQKYLRDRRIQSNPASIDAYLKGQADTLVFLAAARKIKLFNKPEVKTKLQKFKSDLAKQKIYQQRPPLEFNPSPLEVQLYYEKNKSKWREEKPVYVQHIVFPDSSRAGKVREELLAGLDFKEAALKYYPGEKEIREIAYDLGFISEIEMPQPFYQAALKLQPGDLSRPVKTEYGWHLIKLISRNDYKFLDQVEVEIRQILLEDKTKDTQSGWRTGLRKGTKIWINRELLDNFNGQMTAIQGLQQVQEGLAE
jgi:parvulin-like peptidyl-prolyl isomerase